jgi:cytochrome c peroxidase
LPNAHIKKSEAIMKKNIRINKDGLSVNLAVRRCVFALSLNLAVSPVYAVLPMKTMGVPDVNKLGLLDGSGTGYLSADWGEPITEPGKQTLLQQMGKAAFYDMQVGGDGITACASCHFTSGADNRVTNQMSPGLRLTAGGENDIGGISEDFTHQLVGPNGTLTLANYGGAGSERGFPVSETSVINLGAGTDNAANGAPAALGAPVTDGTDVNDVASSQGPRAMTFEGLHCKDGLAGAGDPISCDLGAVSHPIDPEGNGSSPGRQDLGVLDTSDTGFNVDSGFSSPADGIPNTVRHVEPRNTQSVYNTIFNQRSFWDGRADIFFNGVNTLGFRDPSAMVRVSPTVGDIISRERLNVPFSSLASQAMGPIESVLEMVGHLPDTSSGRPNHEMGKKMVNATPLFSQLVACDDSLLGGLTDCETPGTTNRGLAAPYSTYRAFITEIFDERFWGDGVGADICLDADDDFNTVVPLTNCTPGTGTEDRTLMEVNFAMFFALAIQAYEATLVTRDTIVDLLAGGVIPPGTTVTNTLRRQTVTVDLGLPFPGNGNRPGGLENVGLTLEECIELVALNNSAAQEAIATQLCGLKFAEFIHPLAVAGSEAGSGPNQPADGDLVEGEAIGGCNGSIADRNCRAALATLLNIDEGLGRFQAGATGCNVCHFDPTFTGATVAATTGFGAPPPEPFIPAGQLRREELPAFTERMIKFDGAPAVYDAGFYNIAVRPTAEDLGIGWREGGVPLAFTKLKELIADPLLIAGSPFNGTTISTIAADLGRGTGPGELQLPTSMAVNGVGVDNLAPVPFALTLACGPGLVGNGNGGPNNNVNAQCVPDVVPGEFLLRNGAFKTPNLRNVKFTAPFLHNGSKSNLRQVFAFYETIGALAPATTFGFPNMNLANLDAGLRVIGLDPASEAAVVELMETGLTDWASAHEQGKFDHPELCVPVGHNSVTGETILAGIPEVGVDGNLSRLATFEEVMVGGAGHEHDFTDPCTVPGINNIDVPPAPPST